MVRPPSRPRPSRVVIADDDEWVRRGRAQALRERGVAQQVVGIDHDEARAFAWERGDVVLVDAHDGRRDWDRYAGVAVVESVRATLAGDVCTIVVISGHHTNRALRDRCAEAGAHYLFSHEQVSTVDDLCAVVADPGALAERLRATRRGLTEAVRIVDEMGANSMFDAPAPQKQGPLSRRGVITLRRRLSRALGDDPPPRLTTLIDTVNEARGAPDLVNDTHP